MEWGGGIAVDHKHRLAMEVGHAVPHHENCPQTPVLATNYQQLYLASARPGPKWPDMAPEDVDVELMISLADEYQAVMNRMGSRKLTSLIFQEACKALATAREPVHLANDTFVRSRGNVVDVFRCTAKTGQAAVTEKCHKDIKLADGQGFVDPLTRLLKASSPY